MTGGTDKNHYQVFTKRGSAGRDWMTRALCRIDGSPAEIRDYADTFFPHPSDKQTRQEAATICGRCPVRRTCDQHAETLGVEYGVWGGKHLDKDQRGQKPQSPPRCGTERGYYHHLQKGEPIDPACQAVGQRVWERRKANHRKMKDRNE